MKVLTPIIKFLIQALQKDEIPNLSEELSNLSQKRERSTLCQNLNAAFLILLMGDSHSQYTEAKVYLDKLTISPQWGDWAKFYLQSVALITAEIEQSCQKDPELLAKFQQVAATLAENSADNMSVTESIWSVLFPEGFGIIGHETERVTQLREKRTVTIDKLNANPINNPAKQVLFTSNALLTTPLDLAKLSEFDRDFQVQVAEAFEEPQLYWYDHPIPIGIPAESNEILYGLQHLNTAIEFEHQRQPTLTDRLNCVVSVSVTHKHLQTLGKSYLKQVLAASAPLNQLNIFAFTEADTDALIRQVLMPIVKHCSLSENAEELLSVFGVDGRYGRHYSFLKAIAALWSVLVDPDIKATFKIDLDQVFPQAELIEQTGASALEHLQTPLWGATGQDAEGNSIELGMIAGALVNQKDIHHGVFTPDVKFPSLELEADEYVFFSKLPQALSTKAEMMTRYEAGAVPDGENTCLQRIHVTGGTNGILVDALRRFQTFTPSFIGRAEDQAYLLSSFDRQERLGYAHAAGLIMRHDKEGFAQEAIAMAKVGKQIGDYVRILMFSAYAKVLPQATVDLIKAMSDPFTGCFISHLPITVTMLRFSLKLANLFQKEGKTDEALEFMGTGIRQLQDALDFIEGQPSELQRTYERELKGWQLFYQALDVVEKALQARESWALSVQKTARQIVADCRVN